MSEDTLREYLVQQARSLDSLLELTPAKHLFGEDVSDQWQRKKQTPEQKQAARLAKLDPANWKSAKDVYDERSAEAKKRKWESEGGEVEVTEQESTSQPAKKQKSGKSKPIPTEKITAPIDKSEIANMNLKKKSKKRANRRARTEAKELQQQPGADIEVNGGDQAEATSEKPSENDKKVKSAEEKPAKKQKDTTTVIREKSQSTAKVSDGTKKSTKQETNAPQKEEQAIADDDEWSDTELVEDEEMADVPDQSQDSDVEFDDAESTASSSEAMLDILSPPQDSIASSVSSIIPPSQPTTTQAKKSKLSAPASTSSPQPSTTVEQTPEERAAARQRLQSQISQFRSQRKADDRPVKSRADLLAQRRAKELEKKAAKKEQRRKEREEEAKKQDEEIAKRFSPGGSGSLLASPRSPMIDDVGSNAFSFGRIAFTDGTAFDPNTGSAAAQKHKKGPVDAAGALKAAQAKQERISGLDEKKKTDIAEKDMWLNAKKRAHGERVRDDTSLLKKALKRQDKQKAKSSKEWNDRSEGVKGSQEMKQKKRTENLQKRKDEKFARKTGAGKKKVKRPGFEGGSLRNRTGKSKK